ncbi:TIGR03016 family PEP-CTERM system-associated outer membrane protein [Alteromonas flava]|uniref:TIGR03016 family PEP-CTERM system-associated outer membrane protein n=1 Tax=Alteromonas flava TaxID=2048003 RepID=UPI000C287502|nr:TIGR03016 family PEP-CTERM system-associated outer membrane protein [Alteromonas flava]
MSSLKHSLGSVSTLYSVKILPLLLISFFSPSVLAEIEFDGVIGTSLITANTNSDGTRRTNGNTNSFLLNPSLTLSYSGPVAEFFWNIDHTYLYQDIDKNDTSEDRSFTEYQISGQVDIIKNYLQVNAGSQLRYQNSDPSLVFADDFVSGAQNLGKFRTSFGSLLFTSASQRWFDVNWEIRASKIESDQSFSSSANLNNNDLGTYFELSQGREFKQIRWTVTNTFQDTDGRVNGNDLKSRESSVDFGLGIYGPLGLYLVAQDERNQFDGALNLGLRDYTSYGAGLEWSQSRNRRISLALNRSEETSTGDKDEFLSLDMVWAFSARTRLEAKFGRRAYGDSGRFSFVYNTKKLRVAATYDENVTNFSRLVSNFEELGVFVCPVGATEQNQCFLPSSLAYQLQPDEQFNSLFQNTPEISEEVIERRLGQISAGFEAKKLTLSLTVAGGRTQFLQTNRTQDNVTSTLSMNYNAGVKTSLYSTINYNKTDFLDTNTRNQILRAESGIRHQLTPELSISSQLTYTDSDTRSSVTNYQERRVSVSMSYQL